MASNAPALAIDASEWFRDPAWRDHVSRRHWRRLPPRAEVAVANVLELLPDGARATWLVEADLAERRPELLRQLVERGHEVALAVRDASQIERERAAVERAAGAAVRGIALANAAGFDYALATCAADVEVVHAWRLDPEQPTLAGVPAEARAEHEQRVRTGAAALAAAVERARVPIAEALQLKPRAYQPAPEPARARRATPPQDATPLAIVVPLKDEQDGIHALFRELDEVQDALADAFVCRFVCVDDGSTDRTWQLLQEHAAQRDDLQLLRHEHNRGVAAAIRTGILACDEEIVASIDGDLSYDPMELRAMVPLLEEADVVTASPYDPAGGVQNVPEWRLFLSRTLSFAYRVLLRQPIHTWTSCFRVYRRAFVQDLPLRNEGFLGTAELLVRVLRRGGRVVEHPCVLEARLLGTSKMRVLRTVFGHLRLLAQVLLRRIR